MRKILIILIAVISYESYGQGMPVYDNANAIQNVILINQLAALNAAMGTNASANISSKAEQVSQNMWDKAKEKIKIGYQKVTASEAVSTAKSTSETAVSMSKTLEVTKDIYTAYKKTIEILETASEVVRTSKEVKQIFNEIDEIRIMYMEYGITLEFETWYDADKYLNPQMHEYYIAVFKEVYEGTADDLTELGRIISPTYKQSESYRLTEKDRLDLIRELSRSIKSKAYALRRLIYTMMTLAQSNAERKSVMDFDAHMWNLKNY